MPAKERKYVTEAIRRFVRACRKEGRIEFRSCMVPGVHVNTMEARVARYGMVPHRSEVYMPGRFYWYYKVEELAVAIGEGNGI